jgi:hypothetical protein
MRLALEATPAESASCSAKKSDTPSSPAITASASMTAEWTESVNRPAAISGMRCAQSSRLRV